MFGRRKLTISILPALLFSLTFSGRSAFAQMTPQQIRDHQLAVERELQREAEQRDQQQQKQLEQQREAQQAQQQEIDLHSAEQQREQAAKQLRAAEQAELDRQIQLRDAELKAQAKATAQSQNSASEDPSIAAPDPVPAAQPQAAPPASGWSYRNMTAADKAALGALCILLAGLAFASGIIPATLTPKWIDRFLRRPDPRS